MKKTVEDRLKKFTELFREAQRSGISRSEALRQVMKFARARDAKA